MANSLTYVAWGARQPRRARLEPRPRLRRHRRMGTQIVGLRQRHPAILSPDADVDCPDQAPTPPTELRGYQTPSPGQNAFVGIFWRSNCPERVTIPWFYMLNERTPRRRSYFTTAKGARDAFVRSDRPPRGPGLGGISPGFVSASCHDRKITAPILGHTGRYSCLD